MTTCPFGSVEIARENYLEKFVLCSKSNLQTINVLVKSNICLAEMRNKSSFMLGSTIR
jgi:hypothetical protein